jgi:hypothetical protein
LELDGHPLQLLLLLLLQFGLEGNSRSLEHALQ